MLEAIFYVSRQLQKTREARRFTYRDIEDVAKRWRTTTVLCFIFTGRFSCSGSSAGDDCTEEL